MLAQTGCDGCSNAETCEVCSEFGYKLDSTTKKCVCDTEEGFVWNPTLKLCECAPQSYMVNETAPKKGAPVAYNYPSHKKCFKCTDMFNICAACAASDVYMSGTREFTYIQTKKPVHIMCSTCSTTSYFYDSRIAACHPCWSQFGDACDTCTPSGCTACQRGSYVVPNASAAYCASCASKFKYCENCTYSKCLKCQGSHLLVGSGCW